MSAAEGAAGLALGDTDGMVVGDTEGMVVGDTDGMVVGDTDVAGAVLASLPSLLRSTKSLSLLSVPSMGNARSIAEASTATAPKRQTTEERMERAIFFNSEHLRPKPAPSVHTPTHARAASRITTRLRPWGL